MKTSKLIRLIVYHSLWFGILSCTTDEDYPTNTPPPTKLSFSQDLYSINSDTDSVTIPISLSSTPASNGFVGLLLSGDLHYGQDYETHPAAEDGTINLDFEKGVGSASFNMYRKNFNLEEEKSLTITLAGPSRGFVLGGQVTAHIKFERNDILVSEVNFSAEEATISEDAAEGAIVKIDLSAPARKSENLKIIMGFPSTIEYGTHFYTIPAPVLNELSLDIPPMSESISFKVIPIDDLVLLGNFEIKFAIAGMTDGLKMGTLNEFIVTITENDNPTSTTHTISSVRAEFENHQSDWFIPSEYVIEGVITSKDNVVDKAAYIQDATGGILIRFNTPNTLKLGDKIRLNLKDGTGKIINDQKSIDGISLTNAVRHNENIVVEAETITIEQFYSGNYEGKRITLENVEFQNADGILTFVGSHRITQGSAAAFVLTHPTASFSTISLPEGKVSISGIIGDWGRLMPQLYTHDIIQ